MTLWQVDIYPAAGRPDLAGRRIASDAADLGLGDHLTIHAAYGYLLQGELTREQVELLARELLSDPIVERTLVARVGEPALAQPPPDAVPSACPVHVLPKPGVMDPVAISAQQAIADFHLKADEARTFRKYWIEGLDADQLRALCSKVLANDSIEQFVIGPLQLEQLHVGAPYQFRLIIVPIRDLDDDALSRLSRDRQLYLTLVEMQTIQQHYRQLGRDPTDIELETVAQTWSEHCSHKTLAGRIEYRDADGQRRFENMLKETIFAATQQIRRGLGADDWCVSVFKDNAGVVRFDDQYNAVFKVETHNHPSALEPYGGANTGIGGVIRDPLGTGLGAKPVCNTDVFCFAPPQTRPEELPPGVLHPRRVMKGVVAGVRDYGNRMGIPTVNGAVYFDPRYLGNPLVYCGTVGILPTDKSFKEPRAGDWIVAIGGRTGRDGIHGATFSSTELTSDSETVSGGAVQIGNAITEKMLLDVLLSARERGLYHAVTDCGAGGFSSAVGEMGEHIGAEVWLERAPLKYEGLSYTEIWISEAQERMVLSVPDEHWPEFSQLCASEDVPATIIGKFVPTGRLELKYDGHLVGELSMDFLHNGRPPVVRTAVYEPPPVQPLSGPHGPWRPLAAIGRGVRNWTGTLRKILGSLNVASKEWVIRQYDHEVQAGSVVKPLLGVQNDGPSDAAVLRPVLSSRRGLVIACGMNPRYGDFDTYHMAASAIDEAIRNCVAVGADPRRIAILDNFCWGYTDRPETLGSLVRAALACHDLAIVLQTPFISGKDSLNNEFSFTDAAGCKRTISIPPSLLISALGQVDDVSRCVTMDAKQAGNLIYQVGLTRAELGGSHLALVEGLTGGQVPTVDAAAAQRTFTAVHAAISAGCVAACHDLSEGGLAVAAAEMAFAGGLGLSLHLDAVPHDCGDLAGAKRDACLLFSESNTRFLCEVPPDAREAFERALEGVPHAVVGQVTSGTRLQIHGTNSSVGGTLRVPSAPAGSHSPSAGSASPGVLVVDAELADLKEAWQKPLRW